MNKPHALVGASLAAFGAYFVYWDVNWLVTSLATDALPIVYFLFAVWLGMVGLIGGMGMAVLITALRD